MQSCSIPIAAGRPSFRVSVGSVFLTCSKPEMINANTCRIIASVQHPKAVAHMPVTQHPTKTVRAASLSVPFIRPVSVVKESRRPHPAASDVPVFCDIRHRSVSVHFRPKSFRDFLRKLRHNFRSFIHGVFVFGVRAARSVMNSAPLVLFNKKPAAVNTLCRSS